jgi:hypothetical protein
VYQGINVQRAYVAYLVAARGTPAASLLNEIAENMTDATRRQILSLEIALLFTGAWLIIYIVWWIFSNQPQGNS